MCGDGGIRGATVERGRFISLAAAAAAAAASAAWLEECSGLGDMRGDSFVLVHGCNMNRPNELPASAFLTAFVVALCILQPRFTWFPIIFLVSRGPGEANSNKP